MDQATQEMRNFAERLIAHDAKGNKTSEADTTGAFLVVEKLRPHFATLTGKVGFRALLSRALALANAEVSWLRAVHVKADGSLEGLDELGVQVGPDESLEGRVVLLARLLGLMATFIGANLTARLVRDVWPKLSLEDLDFGRGDEDEKQR
jgi:hypothetical protein